MQIWIWIWIWIWCLTVAGSLFTLSDAWQGAGGVASFTTTLLGAGLSRPHCGCSAGPLKAVAQAPTWL